ncbi:MAG: hypothetical protein HON04_01085 [Planctomicrobium sp.]|nr:hypothetical protein [Planctomicrobium sp.]
MAGNTNHSGIGTDLDGGFGKEQCPGDLDTIAEILDSRGYSTENVEKIRSKNFINFFERSLPSAG